jgi:hypothetical protein
MPVTEPRDEIEDWLGADVQPLAPRPGTFERIQRRARRRKTHQALVTGAGALVVVAAVALVPTVAPHLLASHASSQPPQAGPPRSMAASPAQSTASRAPSPTSHSAVTSATSSSPAVSGLTAGTSGDAVPVNFQPTSITMISSTVGAVIGQAGTTGQCSGPVATDCTSLAGTSSEGKSWYGISAPITSFPNGDVGVSQLRFLDQFHAWAFGPQLWESSDSGKSWTGPLNTFGLRVTDLEAAGSRAFALLASCQGSGADYTANCSTFSLYSDVAGSTALQPVKLVTPASQGSTVMGTAGQPSSATIVLTGGPSGGTGYLLSPSGDILTGPLTGTAWSYTGKAPCAPGAANATGTPSGAQLAVDNSRLIVNCTGSGTTVRTGSTGGGQQTKQLYISASGGTTWRSVSQPPASGQATSLASASKGQVILATTTGIDYSASGTTWQVATITGGAPSGGFRYVGMTSATQGVAVPVDASLGEVFITTDGGQTWTASRIVS